MQSSDFLFAFLINYIPSSFIQRKKLIPNVQNNSIKLECIRIKSGKQHKVRKMS